MLSLAQAASKRGNAGQPLPGMYSGLADRQAQINRGQLTLIVGPASAGKSLFAMNYICRAKVPTLAFFLDSDPLTVASRFGAILADETFYHVKSNIDSYTNVLQDVKDVQTVFQGEDLNDIKLQVEAYEARYGAYPSMILIDNLGNMTSSLGDEWAVLKAYTLELNNLALKWQCAIVATHHTTDLNSCEPAQRTAILGRITQYPRLIFSIGFNPQSKEYKVAVVKNSQGPSDPQAFNPVIMWADTARMKLMESNPNAPVWTPTGALAGYAALGGPDDDDE